MITSCGKSLFGVSSFAYVYPDGSLALEWKNYEPRSRAEDTFGLKVYCSNEEIGAFCGRGEVMRICEQCAIKQGIIW